MSYRIRITSDAGHQDFLRESEYWIVAGAPWQFAGRVGYNTQTVGSVDGFTGASFGIGLRYKLGDIDYAFVPFGGIGQAHRISLTWRWGGKSDSSPPPLTKPVITITKPEPSLDASAPTPVAAPTDKLGALIKALKDDDHVTRAKAAIALGKLGSYPAVEPLIEALQDDFSGLRGAAADALGKIGDPRAVEPLISLLQDPEQKVRVLTVRALGQLGDNRALVPLQRLAQDADPAVRDKAGEALKRLGQPNATLDNLLQ